MSDVNENGGPVIDYTDIVWVRVEERLRDILNEAKSHVMSIETDHRTADFYRGQASLVEMMLDWNPHAGRYFSRP